MTKPILWLNSLEELDADYDPLLGRRATEDLVQSNLTKPRVPLDPMRSVFDEPNDAPAAPPVELQPSTLQPAPLRPSFDLLEPNQSSQLERPSEPDFSDETSIQDANLSAIEAAKDQAPTDFTHNNDPIPARQQTVSLPNASAKSDHVTQGPAPKKSLFSALFSKQTITSVGNTGGSSINDIWAKSTPDPEPEVEPNDLIVPDVINVPIRSRNIWTDIDKEPSADKPQDVPVPEPESPRVEADVADYQPPKSESDDNVYPNELPEALTVGNEGPIPVVSELESTAVPNVEPDPTPVAKIDAVPLPNYRDAFNANKFWTLQNAPVAETPDVEAAASSQTVDVSEVEIEPLQEAVVEQIDDAPHEPYRATENSSLVTDPIAPIVQPRAVANLKRRKKRGKRTYVGSFIGTFLFSVALLLTLVSSLAPFGYPFDMMSSYRWYWVVIAVLAAGIWSVSRGWLMVAASFAVVGINLFITVPASGDAPVDGKTATAVIGWANVSGNAEALGRVFKDADKKKASLLMLAEAPQSVLSPPSGWKVIQAPIAGDPTSVTVVSKSTWLADAVPGEPVIARPLAGDLTVIGVHPPNALRGLRRTPMRYALINRAGARAGIQEGPTVVLGDFNAAPWNHAMKRFQDYGNVTRVRCGGWSASTLTQAFGLIGIATDHAYVRDVKVTHCHLGRALKGGNHKPIWLFVAPQALPETASVQP